MKVMIVDDSTVINQGLYKLLSDIEGLEIVSVVEDGLEAMSDFKNKNPDIVVLDLMIPKMSGLDVLRSIRQKNDKTIIIVLTNYNQSYFRDLTSSLGADYFLDKSAEFEKVYAICSNLIKPDPENDTDYLLLNDRKRSANV
jgi:DNA-binding NarL/FixJ family response regulator